MLKPGDKFPVHRLVGGKGPLSLDAAHINTVFYFYPKDDTPGCTIEANEFQKLKPDYDRSGIRIVGVSVDEAGSHRNFCGKFGLAFELATDPGGQLGRELGIMAGDVHKRVTFVVDREGQVALAYPEVKPPQHARQILEDLAGLGRT